MGGRMGKKIGLCVWIGLVGLWGVFPWLALSDVRAENPPGPSDMVAIPAGEFWMGNDAGRTEEQPRHKVYLNAYYLDRFEVTGKDFEAFLKANPHEPPTVTGWYDRTVRPDMAQRPVFGLTWERCRNYCRWRGKRLPTEAEWERAAAGLEQRKYPWGEAPPDPTRANFGRCCFLRKGLVLYEVGDARNGRTPEGVYDLAGNVAEWVYDWYDKNYYKVSPYKNPKGPETGKHHTIRGGAWNSFAGYLRSTSRYGFDEAKDFYGIGCRCAQSASPDRP